MRRNKYDGLMEEVQGLLENDIPDDEIPIPEGAEDSVEESDEPDESDDAP
jgi:hypothetical protein